MRVFTRTFVVLFLTSLVLPDLASADRRRKRVVRQFPLGWCPVDHRTGTYPPGADPPEVVVPDTSFFARHSEAIITFSIRNESTSFDFTTHNEARLDNVAVVEKTYFDAHLVDPAPAATGAELCYDYANSTSSPPDPLFYFDFDPAAPWPPELKFLDFFDTAPRPEWQGVDRTPRAADGTSATERAFWIDPSTGVGAPLPVDDGGQPLGGSLGLGRASDGDKLAFARLAVDGLEVGTTYQVTAWWSMSAAEEGDPEADPEDFTLVVDVEFPGALVPAGPAVLIEDELTSNARVAMSRNGEGVVTWFGESAGTGLGVEVLGRRVVDGGETLSGPRQQWSPGSFALAAPAVSTVSDRFVLGTIEPPDSDLLARRRTFSTDLEEGVTTLTGQVADTDWTGHLQTAFDPAMDRFAARWSEDLGSAHRFRVQIHHGDGTLLSGPWTVSEDGYGFLDWTAVGITAAWHDGQPGVSGSFVVAQRFDELGTPAYPSPVLMTLGDAPETSFLATSQLGASLVGWERDHPEGVALEARILDEVGSAGDLLAPFSLAEFWHEARAASDGEGFLVVREPHGPVEHFVDLTVIEPDGTASEAGRWLTFPPQDAIYPRVAGGPTGSFFIVWRGEVGEILGRRFLYTPVLEVGTSRGVFDDVAGNMRWFRIVVPIATERLEVTTSGGTGEVDLFIRRGERPTESLFDDSSQTPGTGESIVVTDPAPGHWLIGLLAEQSYEGVLLLASYESPVFSDGFESGDTSAWSAGSP